MLSQFEQDLYNKNFSLQDQGKDDEIDTFQNRSKFWFNSLNMGEEPITDNLYDYDYNIEGMDHSVSSAKNFPEIAELKKLLHIHKCK